MGDVLAVGAVDPLPIGGDVIAGDFTIEGNARQSGFMAMKTATTPGYFRAMGIPILRGRDFSDADTPDRDGVVIVTDALARRA